MALALGCKQLHDGRLSTHYFKRFTANTVLGERAQIRLAHPAGCTKPVACALCPRLGAHLLKTKCGHWCHAACALWIPEAFIDVDGAEPVVDISKVPKA